MKLSMACVRALPAALALTVCVIPAGAQIVFDGNILWDNHYRNGNCTLENIERVETQPAGFTSLQLYQHFAHNDSLNPQLADPYRFKDPNGIPPSFVPSENSPASGKNRDVVDPVQYPRECDNLTCLQIPSWAQIEKVCYRGAIPPASMGPDWTLGWTYYNDNGAGRTDIDYGKPLTVVQGDLVGNVHWTNDHNYLLRGRVNVDTLATLTIDPGTVIMGDHNFNPSFLCVQMGGKVFAVGTKTQPIIMTSDQPPGHMAPGDWSGFVLNGLAIANCADCLHGQHCLTEGTSTYHCGTNDCDGSGDIRYVRSEYAGYILSPNNELNSITFCSCGINTRAEYLESFRGLDDLFEWFGGCLTVKRIVGIGGGDDCLDTQMDYHGLVQFEVAQQWGDNGADKGFEWDNNEFDFNAPCRNNPLAVNETMVCAAPCGTTTSEEWGCHLRRGTSGMIYNSIFMGWTKPGLYVQDDATAAQGFYPQPPIFCTAASVPDQGGIAGHLDVRALNPVAGQAMFFVNLPQAGQTRLNVFDLNGRLVHSSLANLGAGSQTISWNPASDGVVPGKYFYRLENNEKAASGQLTILH